MFHKRHPKVGARPGTLVIHHQSPTPVVRVMRYSADRVEEREVTDVAELRGLVGSDGVTWVDVQGFGDEQVIRSIGEAFGLHALALEDVINVPQRPKAEPYDDHLLFITRMAMPGENVEVPTEQVALVVGQSYLLTFQERYGDVLDPVRARIRQGKGPMRSSGPDYLAYAIIDAVVDGYYPVLESLGELLESLEEEIVIGPRAALLTDIHHVKRELLGLRRAVWPQREAVNSLIRDESEFITEHVRMYLRDVYDHCVQIMDAVETYRELSGSLMDVYLSAISNRQNEVMKVLTIMASIFIPLTFLAGVYGMNFEHMPELHRVWGYPILLAVMVVIALGMVVFFRRRGWIGGDR